MSITAEQFVPDLHEILRKPPPYLHHLGDLTHLLTILTYVFWNNASYSLFYKVFFGEVTAQLTRFLTSNTMVISPTCLSTGRAVVVQAEE